MRDRYRAPRRDYGGPVRRPAAPVPHRPTVPAPAAHPAAHHQPAPKPQPVAEHHRPTPHVAPPIQPHRRPKKRRLLKFFIFFLVLAALAGGGFVAYQKYHTKNPFSADIQQNASIDLLYPAKLPAGYTVDPASILQTNGILTYNAKKGTQKLVFTLQKTPTAFDFNTFYKQQIANNHSYSTQFGTAVIGQNSNRSLGSLVDDSTWLLLTTNSSRVSQDDMSLVLTHLKKY